MNTVEGPPSGGVALVVPVKSLHRAKSRLAVPAFDRDQLAALALAFALDTVCAAAATAGVTAVLAVTDDRRVRAEFARVGIGTTPEPDTPGLNAAARTGARVLRERHRRVTVGVLPADLPALKPAELAAAVDAGSGRRAFCADRHGTGTTLLLTPPDDDIEPRFGDGSVTAHARTGAIQLTGGWPSLRCDVDTLDDLRHAMALGLGPHTRQALTVLTGTR